MWKTANGKGIAKEGGARLIGIGSLDCSCRVMENCISVLKLRMRLYLVSTSVENIRLYSFVIHFYFVCFANSTKSSFARKKFENQEVASITKLVASSVLP